MQQEQQLRTALSYIDSNDRDIWVCMGAGIKTELGESGFDVWDEWSQNSAKYQVKTTQQVWKSLKAGHITAGSIFYEAKKNGFELEKNIKPLSMEEIEKRRAANERLRAEQELQDAKAKAAAIKEAQERWENAEAANLNHPYLLAKGIAHPDIAKEFKQEGNHLLIPLKQKGEVVSLQSITTSGDKFFNKNATLSESNLIFGSWQQAKNDKEIILAEGVATAASIHLATGKTTVACFTGENLNIVAKKLDDQDVFVVIAADLDRSGAGQRYAEKAKENLKTAEIVYPNFTKEELDQDRPPSDFNDLAKLKCDNAIKPTFDEVFQRIKKEREEQQTAYDERQNKIQTESEIIKMKSQSQQASHQQVESSINVDTDEYSTKSEVGSQKIIPTEVLIHANEVKGLNNLNPRHKQLATNIIHRTNQVMSKLDNDLKTQMKRNFLENFNKSINGDTLNIPKSLDDYLNKQEKLQQEQTQKQHERVDRDRGISEIVM